MLDIHLHVPGFLTSHGAEDCRWSVCLHHYAPAEQALPRMFSEYYNHQKLVSLKKNLVDLPSRTKESLCLPNHHLNSFSKLCSSATDMPHAGELRWGGWREVGLAAMSFWFCSIKWPGSFMIFPCPCCIAPLEFGQI